MAPKQDKGAVDRLAAELRRQGVPKHIIDKAVQNSRGDVVQMRAWLDREGVSRRKIEKASEAAGSPVQGPPGATRPPVRDDPPKPSAASAAQVTLTDSKGKTTVVDPTSTPTGQTMSVAEAFGVANAAKDTTPLALRGLTPAQERRFIETFNGQFGTSFNPLKGIEGNPEILAHPALEASDIQVFTPDLEQHRRTARHLGEDGKAYREEVERPLAEKADQSRIGTEAYAKAVAINGRSAPYIESVVMGAVESGTPWEVLWGLIHSESGFRSQVTHDIPTVQGIAGIDTRYHKVDAKDPHASIRYAGKLLAEKFARYKDWGLAIIAYKFGDELAGKIFRGEPVDPGRLSYAHELVQRVFQPAQQIGWDGKGALDPSALTELAQSGGKQAYTPPDPVKVEQFAEGLIKGLFFRDPTPGEVEKIGGMVSGLFADANVRARQAGHYQSPYAARAAAADPNAIAHPLGGAGKKTGGFGDDRKSHKHGGIDLAVKVGTPTVAAVSGVVVHRNDPDGYGNYLILKGDDGREYIYAHLDGFSVANGARVERGQQIATTGNSGRSTGPHLHFEVRDKKLGRIDPEPLLNGSLQTPGHEGVEDVQAEIDWGARALEEVRNSPEYERLYGKKPGYMAEEQYAGTFLNAGLQTLGTNTGVVGDEAVRLGLMSGDQATTAGYVAHDPTSMRSGSFRKRLYEVASVMNRFV